MEKRTMIGGRMLTVTEAIHEVQAGHMIILCDDEQRENEADLCLAAPVAIRPAPPRAGRMELGGNGPDLPVADISVLLPGGESLGGSPRRGKVPAVRPAPQ